MRWPTPRLLTDPRIKHLAGVGLNTPERLTLREIRELAASVMAHIEPRRSAPAKELLQPPPDP